MTEFLQHYVDQGVDHFYIINNNSTDNIKEVLQSSPFRSMITLLTDNRNMGILETAGSAEGHRTLLNEHCYERIKQETEWAIVIDADEFMYGKNGYSIKTFLATIDASIGCIYVLWNIIPPTVDQPFSLKHEKKRLNYDRVHELSFLIRNANDFGKSIVRTCMLTDETKLWLHKIFVDGKLINNYGYNKNGYFDNYNEIEYSEENFRRLSITMNHYAIRDADDYLKKQRQIDVVPEKNEFIYGLFEMIDLDASFLVVDTFS
jgi:hypothetical protein